MKIEKHLSGFDYNTKPFKSKNYHLVIDFENLKLEFSGDLESEINETFNSIEEMNIAYQQKAVPYIEKYECYDANDSQEIEHIGDLAIYAKEVEAQFSNDEIIKEDASPVENAVISFTNLLRQRLNKSLGSEAIVLHCAIFGLADSGIIGVNINPPLISDKTDLEVKKIVDDNESTWGEGDFRKEAAFNLEWYDEGEVLEKYGDSFNLYGDVFIRLFYLACARIEQKPLLRENIEIGESLKLHWAFHDDHDISWDYRHEAEEYLNQPVEKYFETLCS